MACDTRSLASSHLITQLSDISKDGEQNTISHRLPILAALLLQVKIRMSRHSLHAAQTCEIEESLVY